MASEISKSCCLVWSFWSRMFDFSWIGGRLLGDMVLLMNGYESIRCNMGVLDWDDIQVEEEASAHLAAG